MFYLTTSAFVTPVVEHWLERETFENICATHENEVLNTLVIRWSVVRALAHGAMGRRIDPSWWTHRAISRSSQCTTTGLTKAMVRAILSVGWCI